VSEPIEKEVVELGAIRRTLSSKFVLLNIGDLLGKACLFFAYVRLAQSLGAAGFGRFAFAQNAILLIAFGNDLGIEWRGTDWVAKVRDHTTAGDHISHHINHVFAVRLLLALLGVLVLAAVSFAVPTLRADPSMVLALAFSIVIAAVVTDWVYVGIGDIRTLVLSRLLRFGTYLVMVEFLVSNPTDGWLAAISYSVAFAIGAGFELVVLRRRKAWIPQLEWQGNTLGRAITASLPFFLYALMSQIYFIFGTILVHAMDGERSTGLFSAAYRVVAAIVAFTSYLISASYPHISDAARIGPMRLRAMWRMLLARLLLLSVTPSLAVCLVARPLVLRLFGLEYLGAVTVLQILSASVPFVMVALLAGAFLNALGLERRGMMIIVQSIVVMLGIALPLRHYFGVQGIALSILTASMYSAVVGGVRVVLVYRAAMQHDQIGALQRSAS